MRLLVAVILSLLPTIHVVSASPAPAAALSTFASIVTVTYQAWSAGPTANDGPCTGKQLGQLTQIGRGNTEITSDGPGICNILQLGVPKPTCVMLTGHNGAVSDCWARGFMLNHPDDPPELCNAYNSAGMIHGGDDNVGHMTGLPWVAWDIWCD